MSAALFSYGTDTSVDMMANNVQEDHSGDKSVRALADSPELSRKTARARAASCSRVLSHLGSAQVWRNSFDLNLGCCSAAHRPARSRLWVAKAFDSWRPWHRMQRARRQLVAAPSRSDGRPSATRISAEIWGVTGRVGACGVQR